MNIRVVRKMKHLARSVYRALPFPSSGAVILTYHRIFEASSDPQLLCVSPENFAEHLEYLRKNYQPISLSKLGVFLKEKNLPARSVVVTFDDGYADNFWNAKPILEQYGIPATIFVTTGQVGQNREFWWDDLERLILLPKHLPENISLEINKKTYKWNLSEDNGEIDLRWNVNMTLRQNQRQKTYKEIHKLLCPLTDEEKESILDYLKHWSGVSEGFRSTYRALNAQELKTLTGNGLIEVGSHGVTHSMLEKQPFEAQKREIYDSKTFLERNTGCKIRSFSYPYGNSGTIDESMVGLVEDAGYKLACGIFPAPVVSKSKWYQLPRYLVRNWNNVEFSRQMTKFFRR